MVNISKGSSFVFHTEFGFVVDKDIGRFEVAVNDALTVHCIQSSEYLLVIPFGC